MSETLLTKCPHCSTTFRLTQAQLEIAGGAVRCGACYQVFHASEHIVRTSVVEEIRQVPAPKTDPVEDAFELDGDKGLDPYDSPELDLDNPDADLFSEDYRVSLDTESTMDEFGYPEKDTGAKKGSDESWAEELLKELGDDPEEDDGLIHDDMDDRKKFGKISSADSAFSLDDDDIKPPPKKRKTGDDLSDTFRNLGMFGSDDPFSISEIEEEEFTSSDANADESWAKAMLDELEEDEKPRSNKKDEGLSILIEEDKKSSQGSPFATRELARSKREAVERAKQQQRQQPRQKTARPTEPDDSKNLRNSETEDFFRLLDEPQHAPVAPVEPDLQLEDLKDLESELNATGDAPTKLFRDDDIVARQIRLSKLQFADEEPERRPLRTALLVLGSLLLVLGLGAQYVYFNFDSAARNPALRPWLEFACQQLGCAVPPQVDLGRIVGTNLVVRSHPHEPNALVVDVIIKNTATFEQPFPMVQLNFEDMNGNPIAQRRFQPGEYIHDTSIDMQRMPSNTPVRLTLEIVDPGSSAVNYQLQFLPAGTTP